MTRQVGPRRWASIAQAAEYAKLSQRTIHQRISDGILPAYVPKGSRLKRVDLDDVDAMIEGRGRIPSAAS
jgi:excisionase family DNA binding protein